MNVEQLLEQIVHLRLELAQIAQDHSFDFQHPRVVQASQHLDNLIVQYQHNLKSLGNKKQDCYK